MSFGITSKLFRYEALLNAIDVFTQKFSLDQLANFAFEFANEVLTLNASMLFVRQGDEYVVRNRRIYHFEEYRIKNLPSLQDIPTFHGQVIKNRFERFFDERDIRQLAVKLVIPLIIHSELYGFIVSDGKAMGDFDDDDYEISNRLMLLFNNSLENSKHFEDLKEVNQKLDQKIFSLFAINQSTKALLSETEPDKLYATAIDVFGEVSSSKVTSLGIYDELTKTVKIKGYRNVLSYAKRYAEFKLLGERYAFDKIVLQIDRDLDIIKSVFENWQDFALLDAKYIVLIVKDRILGFVTLSDPVNDIPYDESSFELIESLASATYIAVTNALLFEQLNLQKAAIEQKYNTLATLNKLVNNINHCSTAEEICQLTLKTLKLSFGIQKAFLCFLADGAYTIQYSIGAELFGKRFSPNDAWRGAQRGDTLYDFTAAGVAGFFDDPQLVAAFGESNCLVISPVAFSQFRVEEDAKPEGYLVVLKTKESLKEEEILLIDTITKNIAPVLRHMNTVSAAKRRFVEDPRVRFLESWREKRKNRELYQIDFYLYYKKTGKHPFQEPDVRELAEFEYYVIDQYVFVFSFDRLELPDYKEVPNDLAPDDIVHYRFD